VPNLSPAALLLISSLTALPLQGAVACSPLPGPSIEWYRNVRAAANSIFIGRVERLTSIEEPIPDAEATLEVLVVSIATTNTIKGVKASRHQLRTPKSSAACGVPIFEKETYLFAAKGDQVVMAIPLTDGTPREPADEEAFNVLRSYWLPGFQADPVRSDSRPVRE